MGIFTFYTVLVGLSVVWMVLCWVAIYRRNRQVAWMAGATVTTCFILLGLTVMISLAAQEALLMMPVWIGLVVLGLIHLRAARRQRSNRLRTAYQENHTESVVQGVNYF